MSWMISVCESPCSDEPDGEYLTASTGKGPGGFHGVTANFARIDLYACDNTNPAEAGRSVTEQVTWRPPAIAVAGLLPFCLFMPRGSW